MMKYKSFCYWIILLCFSHLWSISYKQIAYIPKGQFVCFGFIRAFETNHNELNEIIFTTNYNTLDYEYRAINKYVLANTLVYQWYLFWDVGFLDYDSLCDIIVQGAESIRVYESPDYNLYPTNYVWGADINTNTIASSYITDLDGDGSREILTQDYDHGTIFVFENVADNQYNLVFLDSVEYYNVSCFAFDDFDGDGLMEFVTAGLEGVIFLWECTGDDQYELVWVDTIWISPSNPTCNAYDVISARDMDKDGKPEFIIGSYYPVGPPYTWTAYYNFFEATGNNTYEEIYRDSITHIPICLGAHSASYCGDVDADSVDEAVMAICNNWYIYKATGNNTFEQIFTAYPGGNGRANTSIFIYDMNQNAYKEIIESGSWPSDSSATRVWEIEAVKILYPNGGEIFEPASQETIRWRKFIPPGADSFELFISYNNGLDYQTITTIPQSDESLYVWAVPNTSSDSCLVAIKAYGPGVGWDESDSVFKINPEGIEETDSDLTPEAIRLYQNYPNPFTHTTEIKYCTGQSAPDRSRLGEIELKIYDVAGKLIKSFPTNRFTNQPIHQIIWDGTNDNGEPVANGIYFYCFEIENLREMRKMILIR